MKTNLTEVLNGIPIPKQIGAPRKEGGHVLDGGCVVVVPGGQPDSQLAKPSVLTCWVKCDCDVMVFRAFVHSFPRLILNVQGGIELVL